MTLDAERTDPPVSDAVANVLKWVLLAVAILTFALLAWATTATYRLAPPQPDRFLGADGAVLMTNDDIIAGKGGFQRADLMDYGSLYGMGSYYGEDYTASTLVRLGGARARQHRPGCERQSLRQPHARPAGGRHRRYAARFAEHRPDKI